MPLTATEMALLRRLPRAATVRGVPRPDHGDGGGRAVPRAVWWGYAVSALLHIGLILVLAAVWVTHDVGRPALVIDARAAADVPAPGALTSGPSVPVISLARETNSASATSQISVETARALADRRAAEPEFPDESLASSGRGSGSAGDSGKARSGSRRSVRFFEETVDGTSVVFVIDASKSMAGDRFARARRELSKSLQLLDEWQSFSIIFFNDRAIPLFEPHPAEGLVAVNDVHRRKARRWMLNQPAVGHTRPLEAFQLALGLRPDVIFFLTDGELPPQTDTLIREMNAGDVVIHTIAFQSRAGEPVLKAIAEENGGRYRFVR